MIIELFAKLFHIEVVSIEDCPFIPTSVDGKPVLVVYRGKAILG